MLEKIYSLSSNLSDFLNRLSSARIRGLKDKTVANFIEVQQLKSSTKKEGGRL